ncbi:23S rRNA (guanosine(2251)-2'-O)-methyltransferase RlmB [Tengunoibacter tsumagoiensis]|uniref:23S rRNA (Guanosine(2251)-2'-O)-methyltransferase RlmB n=1 Tax=Tengunoibacter tsumagoiensis TaxID=2014871 RepID=A0A401ZX64_9CHLR|nr:23S rRNA (guanosine(2251)-2'-O)-methyltransferase RlmB [Tengunoibacter tsumagoiensis]GCE11432.1 23S rRNA (guanosine(2251)-2'-O)-methyltransferase RlmB [Tengunoibacter tsumagoiensis]
MPEYIWGRNPILETLHAGRRVKKILLAEGIREAGAITSIVQEAERQKVLLEIVPRHRLDQLSRNAVHQGCLALVEERRYATVDEILAYADSRNEPPFLLILDAIQDVNNLGSLMRTAEAAGLHGVVIPEHRAAEVNATVVKSAAGATEHLLIAQETNLTRTIEELKRQNIWVAGLAGEAKTLYTQANLTGPLALVVGNEGKGISRLVREHCDLLIKLPMYGHINSLNAAVAGSIALYEAIRQRDALAAKQK